MKVRELRNFDKYTRHEVHDMFSPNTKYVKNSGSWGIHGIVRVPNTLSDYVLFVTLGSSYGKEKYDEGIDENGVLTWQSQKRHDFNSTIIKRLISSNEDRDNLYLFLRTTKKDSNYVFLGKLKYIIHDNIRQNPVYFKWQILEWDFNRTKNILNLCIQQPEFNSDKKKQSLQLTSMPIKLQCDLSGINTNGFRSIDINYKTQSEHDVFIGEKGEELVVKYEKEILTSKGLKHLADKVKLTKETLGNNAPYDILSFGDDGIEKYIEVKTTEGSERSPFFFSEREKAYSVIYEKNYYLYRIYDYNDRYNNGKFFILKGRIDNFCNMKAIKYKCDLK